MASRYTGRPRAPSPPGGNLKSPRVNPGNSNFGLRLSNGHNTEDDMFDSDNTYSLVQDSVTRRPQPSGPTYKTRIDRMFGDSEADKRPNMGRTSGNKFGSVSSNSTTSSSIRGGSLASLYQARKAGAIGNGALVNGTPKGGRNGTYDAATVEQIKAQFQAQIEAMMISQVCDYFW